MASNEVTGHQQQFVEEIDYNEIQKEEVNAYFDNNSLIMFLFTCYVSVLQ